MMVPDTVIIFGDEQVGSCLLDATVEVLVVTVEVVVVTVEVVAVMIPKNGTKLIEATTPRAFTIVSDEKVIYK